jgi:hypothetical protein
MIALPPLPMLPLGAEGQGERQEQLDPSCLVLPLHTVPSPVGGEGQGGG